MVAIDRQKELPIPVLREMLAYNPDDGSILWKKRPSRAVGAGALAGRMTPSGYVQIGTQGRILYAHRIAWALTHGEWPPALVDHINGNRADNRLVNLRLATASQNARNSSVQRNSRSGLKGAYWCPKRLKWRACIGVDGKVKSLGRYATAEEAHAAYMTAARAIAGEFARP